jgi:hypothetical protein
MSEAEIAEFRTLLHRYHYQAYSAGFEASSRNSKQANVHNVNCERIELEIFAAIAKAQPAAEGV